MAQPPNYDATIAAFRYEFPLDRIIQSLKYGHRLACATFLSEALLPLIHADSTACIVPVPLSRQRLAERGFNQAYEIGRVLRARGGWTLDNTLVQRQRHTRPQVDLPWKSRHKNIHGAFSCNSSLAERHILLLDDVMTTGATLNELAGVLKRHGAARVTNVVVARALLNQD